MSHHVVAAIRLNISGVVAGRGDNIEYIYTDSKHADALQRIVLAKLITPEHYDRDKYFEMMVDSAEAILTLFGLNRSLYGFDNSNKSYQWWNELYEQRKKDTETAKSHLY
jgi:DNA polymerase elongation subunit (family B)